MGILKPQIKLSYANFRFDGTKCIFPNICRLLCCRTVHKKVGNDGTVQILNEKNFKLKNRFSNFLGALMRRNIIKMKFCVKLKKILFFLFFLAHNFEIHKAIDSNKIEIYKTKNNILIFFQFFYFEKKLCIRKTFSF